MTTISIDDKEYNVDDMNEGQNVLIKEIRYTKDELARLNYTAALFDSRVAFLVEQLKNSLEADDATSEVQEE